MQSVDLTNHFLIAMPNMADPYFSRTLTLVCEHNEQGALGLVVNRPVDMTLGMMCEQVGLQLRDRELARLFVHYGGPVQMDRGFVLHEPLGEWGSTLRVSDRLGLTTSKDVLEALAEGHGPRDLLVTLGYAGWAPGQLEHELAQNAWLTVLASREVLFDLPPEERLPAAMQLLGVDFATLSEDVGHA